MAQLSTSSPRSEGPPRLQEVMGLIPVWDSDISLLSLQFTIFIHLSLMMTLTVLIQNAGHQSH